MAVVNETQTGIEEMSSEEWDGQVEQLQGEHDPKPDDDSGTRFAPPPEEVRDD